MPQRFDSRRTARFQPLAVAGLLLWANTSPAAAQVPVESVGGTRALGMGGAFAAVADDATATWWNPAGLSTLLADAVIEGGSLSAPGDEGSDHSDLASSQARPVSVAVALPMVGFSVNHLNYNEIRHSATGTAELDRQDPRVPGTLRSFASTGVGLTLAQSLGDHVVLGTTVRVLQASAGAAVAPAGAGGDEALDAADDVPRSDRTVFDADVGILATAGRVRLAVVARNVGGHRFETGLPAERFELSRQIRASVALGGPAAGKRDWTIALDADVTATAAPDGRWRSLAAGAERWWARRRFGVRGGLRLQTIDDVRPLASAGGSVALRPGIFAEAWLAHGAARAAGGWGLGARVTF